MRRIGDGTGTRIWQDRWIANHPVGLPFTPPAEDDLIFVSQLLLEDGQWNVEIIRERFCGFDADAILGTRVNGNGDEFWAWEPENHGIYSVRSAYRLLERNRRQEAAVGVPNSSESDWKLIWKLEVPPRSVSFGGGFFMNSFQLGTICVEGTLIELFVLLFLLSERMSSYYSRNYQDFCPRFSEFRLPFSEITRIFACLIQRLRKFCLFCLPFAETKELCLPSPTAQCIWRSVQYRVQIGLTLVYYMKDQPSYKYV